MKIGDLVKMKRGYSEPGLVTDIQEERGRWWIRVLWPDYGPGLEKLRDVEVLEEIIEHEIEIMALAMAED